MRNGYGLRFGLSIKKDVKPKVFQRGIEPRWVNSSGFDCGQWQRHFAASELAVAMLFHLCVGFAFNFAEAENDELSCADSLNDLADTELVGAHWLVVLVDGASDTPPGLVCPHFFCD